MRNRHMGQLLSDLRIVELGRGAVGTPRLDDHVLVSGPQVVDRPDTLGNPH